MPALVTPTASQVTRLEECSGELAGKLFSSVLGEASQHAHTVSPKKAPTQSSLGFLKIRRHGEHDILTLGSPLAFLPWNVLTMGRPIILLRSEVSGFAHYCESWPTACASQMLTVLVWVTGAQLSDGALGTTQVKPPLEFIFLNVE